MMVYLKVSIPRSYGIFLVLSGLPESGEGQKIATAHEVHETTRSSNQDVATLPQLVHLLPTRSSTVNDTRTEHRAVAETPSFIKDLSGQFACRSNDKD